MYQFITLQKNLDYRALMADKEFNAVINYCISQKSDVTLRDIKRACPSISELEIKIDNWVNSGVILRHHGRYQVVGQVISASQTSELCDSYLAFFSSQLEEITLDSLLESLTQSDQVFYVLYALQRSIESSDFPLTYIEESDYLTEIKRLPLYFQRLTGKKTEWLSFEQLEGLNQCLSLPSFFYEIKQKEDSQSPAFKVLKTRLGDVNPTYFLTYAERKLRRIEKGRSIVASEPDIFLESLQTLGYLTVEKGCYQLNVSLIDDTTLDRIEQAIKPIVLLFEETFQSGWGPLAYQTFFQSIKLNEELTKKAALFGFKPL